MLSLGNINLQNPLNKNNGLLRGLVHFWMPLPNSNSSIASVYDLNNVKNISPINDTDSEFTTRNCKLVFKHFSTKLNTTQLSRAPFTVIFIGHLDPGVTTNNYISLISKSTYITESSNFGWQLGIDGSFGTANFGPGIRIFNNNAYNTHAFPSANTAWPAGPLFCAATYNGTTRTLYRSPNSKGAIQVTSGSATLLPSNVGITVCGRPFSGTRPAYCEAAIVYNRVLSSSEIKRIQQEWMSNWPTILNRRTFPINKYRINTQSTVITAYKEVGFKWNVFTTIGKSSSILWNTLILAGLNKQFLWNVYKTVGKNEEFVWNILQTAGVQKEILYDILATTGKTSEFIWNTLQLTNKELNLLWNVRSSTGKSLDILWDIYQNSGKSTDLLWNVRDAVGKETDILWNDNETVGKDSEVLWNTFQAIGKETEFLWDVNDTVTASKNIRLLWNTRANVSKELELSWNILSVVNKNIDLLWNVLQTSGKSVEFKYHVRELVFKAMESVWDVRGLAAAEKELLWNVISDVTVEHVYEMILNIRLGVNIDTNILIEKLLDLSIRKRVE